jgi:CHAT domain-containing protein
MRKLIIISLLFSGSLNTYSQEWNTFLSNGSEQMQSGDFDKAILSFTSAINELEGDTENIAPYIMARLLRATNYSILGKFSECEMDAIKGNSLAVNFFGKNSEAHYQALRVLSSLHCDTKREPLKYAQMLVEEGEKIMGKYNENHLQDIISTGRCLIDQGKAGYLKAIIDDINRNGKKSLDSLPNIKCNLHSVLANIYRYEKNKELEKKEYQFLIDQLILNKDSTGLSALYRFPAFSALTNLANMYAGEGNEHDAIDLMEKYLLEFTPCRSKVEAINIMEMFTQLGDFYRAIEMPQKAKENYLKGLQIIEQQQGRNNQFYYSALQSIASLSTELSLFHEADSLYGLELDFFRSNSSDPHDITNCLLDISFNKIQWGKYDDAKTICLQILTNGDTLKGNTPALNVIICYSRLGLIARNQKKFKDSEQYYTKAIAYSKAFRGVFGDFNYISEIHNLAYLYFLEGKYEKAEKQYDKILSNVFIRTLETNRRDQLAYCFEAATLAYRLKEHKKSLMLLSKFTEIQNKIIESNLQHLPIKEQLDYIVLFKRYCSVFNSLAYLNHTDEELINACYSNYLSTQNLTFKVQQAKLSSKKNNVEIYAGTLKEHLRENEAAVEIISFPYFNSQSNLWTDSTLYAAIVSTTDKPSQFVFVSSNKEIDSLNHAIKDLPYNQYYTGLYADSNISKSLLHSLNEVLMGINTAYVIESGALHELNLSALLLNNKETFGQKYCLHIMNSTSDILNYQPIYLSPKTLKHAFIYGGIDYNRATITPSDKTPEENNLGYPQVAELANRSAITKFGYLPSTKDEAQNIQQLCNSNSITAISFTGENATEASFKQLSGKKEPFILHIATHGYFFPDPMQSKQEKTSQDLSGERRNVFKWSDDPLLRSGLIFAGANNIWGKTDYISDSTEDGILTSYEISNLDLSNCQLVVLSACETGLGDIKGSEGVFGLQRAFKMAGVKNIIMSLWKVPDKETQELMTLFYNYCFAGKSVHDALQSAQSDMKKKYPPYYWAAFKLLE